jgi:hypothetical protein
LGRRHSSSSGGAAAREAHGWVEGGVGLLQEGPNEGAVERARGSVAGAPSRARRETHLYFFRGGENK